MIPIPITLNNHPQTLLHQARWLSQHRADHTALVMIQGDAEEKITYAQFFDRAARFARALEDVGVRPGDLVALVLQHGPEVVYGFWGALMLGAIPSVFPFLTDKLDPARYFTSLHALIDHSDVRVIISYSDLLPQLRETLDGINTLNAIIDAENLNIPDLSAADVTSYLNRNPATAEDTAFLQHSSGSTGLQKGVMLSHRAVLNQIASYSEAIQLRPDDIIVSWLPLYHDMGLIACFILPILQGITLVLMSSFQWVRDPKILLHAIHHHHGTLCWLPNFAYNFLATRVRDSDIEGLRLDSMRAFINCSEPVYAESHHQFAERYTPYGLHENALTTCYAMAENTFAVTQSQVNMPVNIDTVDRQKIMDQRRALPAAGEATQTFVSCGKPIENCEIRVLNEMRQPVPERHVGEIVLKSNSMLSGYFRRPDLTTEVMQDGWYLTGDMGYIADSELYITGRKKDLIIVGGKNVYPQDIENLLNDVDGLHPGRATAFGVLNDKLGTEDIAIVAELNGNISPDDSEIRSAISREIRARIAQNTDVTARFVHLVDPKWLIKTSSGKIARSANREKFIKEVLNG